MHDITTKADIELLVTKFYEQVIPDPVIGGFFTKVAHFSWEEHIPILVSFWDSLLLGANTYKGNPMIKHIELNALQALQPEHFERWLQLWVEAVNANFAGPKADEAISRAQNIAGIMQLKIGQQ